MTKGLEQHTLFDVDEIARYLDWPIADPAEASLDAVWAIRDDIDARVRALLTDLTSTT